MSISLPPPPPIVGPREIFPMVMNQKDDPRVTDFRPRVLPADVEVEEEVTASPKDVAAVSSSSVTTSETANDDLEHPELPGLEKNPTPVAPAPAAPGVAIPSPPNF